MGGEMRLESVAGEGSTLSFTAIFQKVDQMPAIDPETWRQDS